MFVRDFCSIKDNDFKKAAEQYRNLSEKDKAKYVSAAEESKRTYQAEMEVYMESLTEEERQLLKKSNTVTVKAKTKPKPKATAATAATDTVTPTPKKALAAAAKGADSGSALNGSARKRKSVSDASGDPIIKIMKVEKIAEPEKVPS